MSSNSADDKHSKISIMSFVLMLFTSVFGFNNATRAFYNMGYAAIPWYILAAIGYGIPFAIMVAEMASAFKDSKGGFYSWLEPVIGKRIAFIGMFMWYTSYIIWMVSVSSSGLWISSTTAVFGYDKTQDMVLPGLSLKYNQILSLLAALWMIFVTYISSRGLKSISLFGRLGGYAVWALNFVLLFGAFVLFIAQGGSIAFFLADEGKSLLMHSPNPNYQTPITIMSFLVYAIFAFGGMETSAGLVDKIDQPEKKFPKGLLSSAIVIAVGYAVAIMAVGVFTNWYDLTSDSRVNLGTVTYFVLGNLGTTLAQLFGASAESAQFIGSLFSRFAGLGLFLSLSGAFFTLIYAPLKQLIEGTPQEIWPKFLLERKNDVPVAALWTQAALVIILLLLNSIGGQGAEEFIKFLTEASNVAMSLPYIFITIAYWFFIKNKTITKPFRVFKNDNLALAFSVFVTIILVLANFFAVLSPTLSALLNPAGLENEMQEALVQSATYIAGPIIFTVIALLLLGRSKSKS